MGGKQQQHNRNNNSQNQNQNQQHQRHQHQQPLPRYNQHQQIQAMMMQNVPVPHFQQSSLTSTNSQFEIIPSWEQQQTAKNVYKISNPKTGHFRQCDISVSTAPPSYKCISNRFMPEMVEGIR